MEEKHITRSFVELGKYFNKLADANTSKNVPLADEAVQKAFAANQWFTLENIRYSFDSWGNSLKEDKIGKWLSGYQLESTSQKRVGIIMAGNIPLVGLHDLLCVLASGNKAICKPSSKDYHLMHFVTELLKKIDNKFQDQIEVAERLNNIDAIIATGSNNSLRYFDYYFGKKPHLFRSNRTSIAVLDGSENEEELKKLADDIFQYFGLGCRNVTKLYLPENFDLDRIFKAVYHKHEVAQHNKYSNNYDYNKAIYLLNKDPLLENGFLLLKEDEGMFTPVSVVFYERYSTKTKLKEKIERNQDQIQCIVSNLDIFKQAIPFGKSQQPELWDYADNVDTLRFLENL